MSNKPTRYLLDYGDFYGKSTYSLTFLTGNNNRITQRHLCLQRPCQLDSPIIDVDLVLATGIRSSSTLVSINIRFANAFYSIRMICSSQCSYFILMRYTRSISLRSSCNLLLCLMWKSSLTCIRLQILYVKYLLHTLKSVVSVLNGVHASEQSMEMFAKCVEYQLHRMSEFSATHLVVLIEKIDVMLVLQTGF